MSDLRKAAEMALDALQQLQGGCTDSDDGTVEAITVWCPEVIDALESALPQPAEAQEPVQWQKRHPDEDDGAWVNTTAVDAKWWAENSPGWEIRPLYTRPAAQPVQVQAPQGWRGMLEHVCAELEEVDDDTVQAQLPMLRAMLAAAPLPPAQPQEPVNRRLLEALIELREQCSGVSPFANAVAVKSSVLEIRRVGRFMAACEQADEAIAAAKVVESDV